MKRILTESTSITLLWIATSVLKPGLAFATTGLPAVPAASTAQAAETAEAEPIVSDGSALSLDALGVLVTPPKGWEVDTRKGNGMAVIMSEPKVELKKVKKEVTTYQRNITVTVKHEATPIDDKTAAALAESLKKEFSKSALIRDYDIMETKIFDFAPKTKALLVYASFRLNGVNMMQMHVLVSGGEKQFLQTYTDMATRFSPTDAGFTLAWASMTSLQVKGSAPVRYENIIKFGSAAGIILLLLSTTLFIRSRSRKKMFQASVMALDSDEDIGEATSHVVSNAWGISGDQTTADTSDESGDEFKSNIQEMPVTAVNPANEAWALSAAIPAIKVPKFRVKAEEPSEEVEIDQASDSDGADWVLPVRTRISPSRVSFG
jgi:hypothetical protein